MLLTANRKKRNNSSKTIKATRSTKPSWNVTPNRLIKSLKVLSGNRQQLWNIKIIGWPTILIQTITRLYKETHHWTKQDNSFLKSTPVRTSLMPLVANPLRSAISSHLILKWKLTILPLRGLKTIWLLKLQMIPHLKICQEILNQAHRIKI